MRALLSVFDKTGIVDLAEGLHALGWELVSSGGTARTIAEAGVPVVDVADYTGSPIMLGHRVVTLHPRIHGGILADRDDPEHQADLETHGIDPIDLVVGNLYPFSAQPGIEMIDIGGPTMVRAAAKNHAHVGVVVDPADYDVVLVELQNAGHLSPAPGGCSPARRSPTPPPTTPPSSVGSTTPTRCPTPTTRCPTRCTSRSSGCRISATARTRTRSAPGIASPRAAAGGTSPPSTTARR
jgi:hypothetical protein